MRMLSFCFPYSVMAITRLLNTTLLVPLGAVAIWGLHGHRDWARRICIVLLTITCIDKMIDFVLSGQLHWALTFPYPPHMYIPIVTNAIPYLFSFLLTVLLTIFLATGLRRRSLIRRGEVSLPLLKKDVVGCRSDWLLPMTLILLGIGLIRIPHDMHLLWNAYELLKFRGGIDFDLSDTGYLAKVLLGSFFTATAITAALRIWYKPSTVRTMLSVVALLAGVHSLATGFTISMVRLPDIGLVFPQIRFASALDFLHPMILPLGLVYFAFRFVGSAEIEHLSRRRG